MSSQFAVQNPHLAGLFGLSAVRFPSARLLQLDIIVIFQKFLERELAAMENTPEMRIGNPERSRAIDLLSERFASGYLNVQEFEDRTGQAAQAMYKSELDALIADLPAATAPESRSAQDVSPLEAEHELQEVRRKGKLVNKIDATLWGIAIIIMFVGIFTEITDKWWIVFPVAAIGSWVAREVIGLDDSEEEIYEELEEKHKAERQKRIQQAYERKRELGQ